MSAEGPYLQTLTRHLAECPGDFLVEPAGEQVGWRLVGAVLSDLLLDLGSEALSAAEAAVFGDTSSQQRNYRRVVRVCAWLLYHEWFRAAARFGPAAKLWLVGEVKDLGRLIAAEKFVTDPDRREELVRLCLRALDLHPAGETETQAADRLESISSMERDRVIRETRASEAAARKLREAMERKQAREAAAKASREW
ncbi:MAG: hypothetical protein JXQ27_01650 [Acidobacteria bacterium]|nr:hypothetical protein [Acidobacteriota bacterium]